MYWQIDKESQKVIFKEEQRNVLQIILYDDKKKGLFASKGEFFSKKSSYHIFAFLRQTFLNVVGALVGGFF